MEWEKPPEAEASQKGKKEGVSRAGLRERGEARARESPWTEVHGVGGVAVDTRM